MAVQLFFFLIAVQLNLVDPYPYFNDYMFHVCKWGGNVLSGEYLCFSIILWWHTTVTEDPSAATGSECFPLGDMECEKKSTNPDSERNSLVLPVREFTSEFKTASARLCFHERRVRRGLIFGQHYPLLTWKGMCPFTSWIEGMSGMEIIEEEVTISQILGDEGGGSKGSLNWSSSSRFADFLATQKICKKGNTDDLDFGIFLS